MNINFPGEKSLHQKTVDNRFIWSNPVNYFKNCCFSFIHWILKRDHKVQQVLDKCTPPPRRAKKMKIKSNNSNKLSRINDPKESDQLNIMYNNPTSFNETLKAVSKEFHPQTFLYVRIEVLFSSWLFSFIIISIFFLI